MKIKFKQTVYSLLLTMPGLTFSAAPNPATQSWVLEKLGALQAQIMQAIAGISGSSGGAGTPCLSSDMRCAIFATRTLFIGDMTVTDTDSLPPNFTGFTNTDNTLAGALSRATQICNAEGAILVPGSTWMPWLSSSAQNAASTLNPSANYYRAGGAGWIATGAGLIVAGNSTAYLGTSIDGTTTSTVYTGTQADGTSAGSGQYDNCADWTDLSGEAVGGVRNASNENWTMNSLVGACSDSEPIYCVQQVKNG